jgi:hypothetical protein
VTLIQVIKLIKIGNSNFRKEEIMAGKKKLNLGTIYGVKTELEKDKYGNISLIENGEEVWLMSPTVAVGEFGKDLIKELTGSKSL